MRYSIQTVTAPGGSVRVVELATVKAHCRIDVSDDDALLDIYQLAAIAQVEQRTGVRVLEQVVRVLVDAFDQTRPMLLPVGPIRSVDEVEYIDAAGAAQTVLAADYAVSISGLGGRIDALESWPVADSRLDAVRIECSVGWSAAAMPGGIKLAVLLLVGHWYINREAVGTVGDEVALAFDALLAPYRLQFAT